jgi:hypothetical protein
MVATTRRWSDGIATMSAGESAGLRASETDARRMSYASRGNFNCRHEDCHVDHELLFYSCGATLFLGFNWSSRSPKA